MRFTSTRIMSASMLAESSVTQLLNRWAQGQGEALDRLLPLVYDELRRIARRHMSKERSDHLLQTTALVHEAFLRLGEPDSPPWQWQSRGQFFGWMSTLMRRILVEHARSRDAAKRGKGMPMQGLEMLVEEGADGEALLGSDDGQWASLLQLDEALGRLEQLDPRQGQVIELRFFGGLSVEQTAEALSVSVATVKREWATARAWLLRELRGC